MKWIFYFMLLVNLGLLAWLVNNPQKQVLATKPALSDVGDLKIVSDVELQVRADFQRDLEKELKHKKKPVVRNTGEIEDELPRVEYDDFIFDEDDAKKAVCRQLGPFRERKDAMNIASGLAAYRLVTKLIQETEISGYWALLPAQATVKESNQLVEELKKKGLVDVRRFTTGELENAISLGLFSSEINAIKRVRSVEKLGYVAIVKAKVEEKDAFWLEFMQSPGFSFPMKGVRTNFPDVEIKPCSGIAPN
jgi:hypothetical protein